MQRSGARAGQTVLLALVVMSMSGALIIRETTRFGSGLREDSFIYMSSAEGIAGLRGYARETGDGSLRPITGFPPGYSFSLAILTWLGIDLHAGVRLLGGLGFSTLVLLAGVGVGAATRSAAAALMSATLVLASPTLIDIHGWALSESVYLALCLAAIFLTTEFLRSVDIRFLILGGLVVGMATLTRYAGLFLAAALGACLAMGLSKAGPKRWRVLAAFAGLSLGPLVAFLVRNVIVSGGLANRPPLSWRSPQADLIERAGRILSGWLLPIPGVNTPDWLSAALASLLIAGLVAGTLQGLKSVRSNSNAGENGAANWLVVVLGMHSLLYLAGLFVSMSTADPSIQSGFIAVGERLLAPVHLNLMLLIPLGLFAAWKQFAATWRLLIVGVGMLLTLANLLGGIEMVGHLREEGRGFNSGMWRSSPAMAHIRELPEIPIYTNEIAAVYLLAGRYASFIPANHNPSTQTARMDYVERLEDMRRSIRDDRGILAILGRGPRERLEPEYLSELAEGLTLVEEFADGLIYRHTGDN